MFRKILSYAHSLLSDSDGTPSSTRVLMYLFSLFSMHLLWGCFRHIYTLTDTMQVSVWLTNMPMLITALCALIALPYAINKSSITLSDIAAMMTNVKNPKAPKSGQLSVQTSVVCDTCGKPKV
jgi:hypothetical protein